MASKVSKSTAHREKILIESGNREFLKFVADRVADLKMGEEIMIRKEPFEKGEGFCRIMCYTKGANFSIVTLEDESLEE